MFLEAEVAMGKPDQAPAGTDQLDLEAAEQLIQLSGGDGESETKSADSVKCCCREKDKEATVESRSRRAERIPARKDGAGAEDCDGLVDDGEARKRLRFRSIADIYRETEKKRAGDEEGASPRKMKRVANEEGESLRKNKRGDEVIPMEASKETRRDLVVVHTHV